VSSTPIVKLTLFVIPCNFFGHGRFINVANNATSWVTFHPKISIIHETFHHISLGCKICRTLFQDWHFDELKVSWDDSICKLIHRTCRYKSHHIDLKYHMTLNTTCSVVNRSSHEHNLGTMHESALRLHGWTNALRSHNPHALGRAINHGVC